MDISAKHMLRKARDATNLSRLVASEAPFCLHQCEPHGGRADPGEQEPLRAEHRREEKPAAGHVLAWAEPAHQRKVPAERTGGEGMNGYRRQYRSTPSPEAIRGMAMLKCMACTGLAVFAALAIWIYL